MGEILIARAIPDVVRGEIEALRSLVDEAAALQDMTRRYEHVRERIREVLGRVEPYGIRRIETPHGHAAILGEPYPRRYGKLDVAERILSADVLDRVFPEQLIRQLRIT